MTILELEALLNSAVSAKVLFGDQPDKTYREFSLLCHPDRFQEEQDKEYATRIFTILQAYWQQLSAGEPEPVLRAKGATYTLKTRLGRGDVSDVYAADCSQADGSTIPVVVKMSVTKDGNDMLQQEMQTIKSLLAENASGFYLQCFPQPVADFLIKDDNNVQRRVSVFKARDGFYSAAAIKDKHPVLDARHLAWMCGRLLQGLGYVHKQGLAHGAVLPPHIMFHAENHGAILLGWTHSVSIGKPLVTVPAAFKPWYPLPELSLAQPASPALDIYLAIATIAWLSGWDGKPPISFGSQVPPTLIRFWMSCLFTQPAMRPQSAWALCDEYYTVLESVFGPKKYLALEM